MSNLVNEGARAKRDDEIKCPGCGESVARCLAADLECPCRELHEAVRGMDHTIRLMQARIKATEKDNERLRAEVLALVVVKRAP